MEKGFITTLCFLPLCFIFLYSVNVTLLANVKTSEAPSIKNFTGKVGEEQTQNEAENLLPYPLQARFDPFALWSIRDQVSKETVSGVLKSVARDSPCYKNSLSTPINSVEQVALAIRKKFPNQVIAPGQKLVFAVIGDSVAADKTGFVDALQSFLTVSLTIDFPVEVRNYASGGKGPRYFSTCNDLRGDEDIVLFENVRPYEADGVLDLASSLVSRGYGVILYNWHPVESWNLENQFYGFEKPSTELGLPLFSFPVGRERIKEALPANSNFSVPEEKQIYRDEVHPNPVGQIIIATMIGQFFEDAVRLSSVTTNLDWNEVETKRLSGIVNNTTNGAKEALCFSQLNCAAPPAAGEEFGYNRCLDVKSSDGFEKKFLREKVWWQGTQPGHSIEIIMPGTCSEISVFHNLRVTNGMVKVLVDSLVLESPLTNGTLDGWYKGFDWLPKERGHNIQSIIATDLPKAERHIVRLIVLNETNSEDGTYKFDMTGMGCK